MRLRGWIERTRLAAVSIAGLAAAACAAPAQRIDRLAERHGFTREVLRGELFEHVVYRNDRIGSGAALHVYIEGDGRPYADRYTVSRDPTPRSPVMLDLMALDDAPSAYLGRPCYFGLTTSACSPIHWTIGRFGEDVVASMAAAVETLRRDAGSSGVVLMGHSGGAAIAALVARRLTGVDAVVTIGGNLDTSAWTHLHGYAPLALSLNPSAERLTSVPTVLHIVGANDDVTPPAFVEAAARKLGPGEVRIVDGARHTCCWRDVWRGVLEDLRRRSISDRR